jgi:hypothetical protein
MATAERELRAAQNQMMFRSVNDRIKELGESVMNSVAAIGFACECEDTACATPIKMSLEEFAAIEVIENRFIVLSGHERLEVEDVLDRRDGYLIVAKRGAGAEFVAEHS